MIATKFERALSIASEFEVSSLRRSAEPHLPSRFKIVDTYQGVVSDPVSLHKYLYANGNPVDGFDPSGHSDTSLAGIMVSIGIGAVISAADAYGSGKPLGEIAWEAAKGGFWGGVLYPLAFVKYVRAVAAGVGLTAGIVSTWNAYYVDNNPDLAFFRGTLTGVAALTVVGSAIRTGVIGVLPASLRPQVRAAAIRLGISATQSAVNAEDSALLKAAMASGEFDYSAPRGKIGGWKVMKGGQASYVVGAGHTRMTAALEIAVETGDESAVNNLIKNGLWSNGLPSGDNNVQPWPTSTDKLSRSGDW